MTASDADRFDRPRGHRLEVAALFARALLEAALLPVHLALFLPRRRAHRERFRAALREAAP